MPAKENAVELDKRDMRKLAKMARNFPKEFRRAKGRAGSAMRGKMRKVMRVGGGIENVPKFRSMSEVTVALKSRKRNTVKKLGGKLTKAFAIQMFEKTKDGFSIGFLTAMEPYARAFQTGENRTLTKGEKGFMRNFGVKNQTTYNRPKRPVVDPFSRGAIKDLAVWTMRNVEKVLAENAVKE